MRNNNVYICLMVNLIKLYYRDPKLSQTPKNYYHGLEDYNKLQCDEHKYDSKHT
jgi:hypothetical protein